MLKFKACRASIRVKNVTVGRLIAYLPLSKSPIHQRGRWDFLKVAVMGDPKLSLEMGESQEWGEEGGRFYIGGI